jgi:hypothetical protein
MQLTALVRELTKTIHESYRELCDGLDAKMHHLLSHGTGLQSQTVRDNRLTVALTWWGQCGSEEDKRKAEALLPRQQVCPAGLVGPAIERLAG